MKRKYDKKNYEMNKPSSLIHGQVYKNDKSFYKLTPIQFDMLNLMQYKVKEEMMKKFGSTQNMIDMISNEEEYHIFEKEIDTTWYYLKWSEIKKFLSRYNANRYDLIDKDLKAMTHVSLTTNAIKNNKSIGVTTFNLVRKYTKLKHQIRFKLEPELIIAFLFLQPHTDEAFVKLKLKVQAQKLKSVGSKRLYEFMKDYEKINSKIISLEDVKILLNVSSLKSNKQFGTFNRNHLKKAVNEINEKSDIKVSYEPIKEKPEGERKQVTKIKFTITKQPESRLQQLGLIEEPITSLPFYNKSKSKLDKLVKNGYKVIDEDMWIQTDIKKNEDRYDAEVRIDKWLKETDTDDRNDIYKILANILDECDDPMVVIEDYRIVGLFTKEVFTKSPKETIDKLNYIIKEMNDCIESE